MVINNKPNFSIRIKAKSGNTVGFINLTKAFMKATTKTATPTIKQVQAIQKGKLIEFLLTQTIVIESDNNEIIDAENF